MKGHSNELKIDPKCALVNHRAKVPMILLVKISGRLLTLCGARVEQEASAYFWMGALAQFGFALQPRYIPGNPDSLLLDDF